MQGRHEALECRADRVGDVLQHDVSGDAVELHRTAAREEWEVLPDLTRNTRSGTAQEGAVTGVESEKSVLRADEVEDRQAVLAFGAAETAPELLEKYRRALSRPKEKYGVDLRDVDSFVEEVDRE